MEHLVVFPLYFPLFISVIGAHGWVVRFCQPSMQSPSWSSLPNYCGSCRVSQAPNLHAATQLLICASPFFCSFLQEIRGWRSLAAVSHIGTAILSSAITTVVASIPLCLTTIQLFAKFGQILAINTVVSIFFTLTTCVALLRLIAPVRFRPSGLKTLKALFIVLTVYGVGAAILFVINWKGVIIPGPSGKPLFPRP